MKIKDSFHPYAITTIIFWSLAFVYTKLALQHFSALSLGFVRYLLASIVLLIVVIASKIKPPKPKDYILFAMSGGLGFFLYMVTFNMGSTTVTAATSSIIVATAPIMTALMALIIYKEKIKAYQWVAVGIEFIGILVLTLLDGSFSTNAGVIWLLLAAVCLSSYNMIQRKITKTYSAMQSSAYSIFAGTIMLAIFAPKSINEMATAPPIQWFYIVILGVFSSAVAYVCWAKAFAKAEKTTYVSNYMFLTPFLASIEAVLIGGETLSKSTIFGGIIIMSGVFLFNKANYIQKK